MPTINPNLVPTISPGNIFSRFTEDTTLNIRWLTPLDPVLFEAVNRPMADITLRQLILAKAIDNLQLRLSHQALFPFLVPCTVIAASSVVEMPLSWIWDMHVSVPCKWRYLRLAKIKRISGSNSAGSSGADVTGKLRLIFTAQQIDSAIETALFYADYNIDSIFTYQPVRVTAVPTSEESIAIDPSEADTICGEIIFRTLDVEDADAKAFLASFEPPATPTDSNSDGIFDNPTSYDVADSAAGGITNPDDFLASALSHGTGTLVVSAYNSIPPSESDFKTWLGSANYPFRVGASRTSINGVVVPKALFNEFSIVAPAPDQPTGDTSKLNAPVWLSSIERLDLAADQLKFVFSTYTQKDDGNPQAVEFASLILDRDFESGRVVAIEPITNLLKVITSDADDFNQGFGLGHVVLSSLWGSSGSAEVEAFFDAFLAFTDLPAITTFALTSAVLSSYALSRVPKTVPTKGQSDALKGSTSRLAVPLNPSDDNRFVTEKDQGLGDTIDFSECGSTISEHDKIEGVGYTGSLTHRLIKLVIDTSDDTINYETDLAPRLRCLLGRDPIFGDMWFDGTVFKCFNGDTWQAL